MVWIGTDDMNNQELRHVLTMDKKLPGGEKLIP